MRITHTSASQMGQIYIAPINWMLMVCTIGLVIGFHSSSKLAAAYGVAVTTTMLITTVLFFMVARRRWRWGLATAGLLCSLFLVVDIAFFTANLTKIFHGAWFPLVIGALIFTVMLTWERGRKLLARQFRSQALSIDELDQYLEETQLAKVPGRAIFLTGNPDVVPIALMHNMKHNRILHSDVAVLHIVTEEIPRVPSFEKVEVQKLRGGFYQITARFGFMEEPKIATILSLAREKGVEFDAEETSFFLGRQKLSIGDKPHMFRWRANLFLFMARNATDVSSFFDIPPAGVIEVGVQLEL